MEAEIGGLANLQNLLIQANLTAGKLFYLEKRFPEAADMLSEVISREPENKDARYYRGLSYSLLRETEKAHEDLSIAAENSSAPETFMALARTKQALSDFAGAMWACEQALRLDTPDVEGALIMKGRAFAGLQEFDSAIAVYEQCLTTVNERSTGAVIGKGLALMSLAERRDTAKWHEAIEWFSPWIARQPRVSDYLVHRGYAYLQGRGDWGHAIADFRRGQTINPRDTKVWEYEGDAWYGATLKAWFANQATWIRPCAIEAERCFKEGAFVASRYYRPVLHNKLSLVSQMRGNYREAVADAKMSTEISDDWHNHLAFVTALISDEQFRSADNHIAHLPEGVIPADNIAVQALFALFKIMAAIGRGTSASDLKPDIRKLASALQALPTGKLESWGWDWHIARSRIQLKVKHSGRMLLDAVLNAVDGTLLPNELRSTWG